MKTMINPIHRDETNVITPPASGKPDERLTIKPGSDAGLRNLVAVNWPA